jgi:ribonuclease M5
MENRKTIQEVIVVEGKNDTANLKKYYDCDTIETNGTHLGREILALIAEAKARRGVIIFTDPDAPGDQTRAKINAAVEGCRNAFIDKKKARTAKKVGVEHASHEALEEALSHTVTYLSHPMMKITPADLYELGLSGQPDSQKKREELGTKLHISFTSARAMCRMLNCLGMSREDVREAMME